VGVGYIPDVEQEYDKKNVWVKDPKVGDKVWEISGSTWEDGVTFGICDDKDQARSIMEDTKKKQPSLIYWSLEEVEITKVTEDKITILIEGC